MARTRPHFLEEHEVRKLMGAAAARTRYKERDQALIAVMFYMGLKPSETERLDCAHIRFDERLVYITGPRGKPRTQPLDPDAETIIQRWMEVRENRVDKATAALFTSDERVPGKAVKRRLAGRTMRTDIERCARGAGLDVKRVRLHAIRHSFMVRQLRKHIPPEIVEELLGLTPVGSPSSVIALARDLAKRDSPTHLLHEAWSDVFGSNLRPSNGYRAAVGAVEAVAIMTVQPDRPKATLGTVIAELKDDLRNARTGRPPRAGACPRPPPSMAG